MTAKKKQTGAIPKKKPDKPQVVANETGGKEAAFEKELPSEESRHRNFPIVGLGASAGGLEAFEAFFKEMPATTGMAFVLVAHLDPTHVSLLPELLQRRTIIPVHQITDGVRVLPDTIYTIPPNKDLQILNGTLHLLEASRPRGTNMPIDTFFRSLAQDQGDNAVGIILSGTGSDGTLGLKAIKGEAGMVMVQDEKSAKYDGMPRSAMAANLPDHVLPPEQLAEQLLRFVRHATRKPAPGIVPAEGTVSEDLHKIFIILRTRTNLDFSLYKRNTLCRRIERRMNVHQIDNLSEYVRYLKESEREAGILFKELLINVTNFFRDAQAFEVLQKKFLGTMIEGGQDDHPVRVWVPGCSTGEEVYTIGILLAECMEQLGKRQSVQIFGTDIDRDAVDKARSGLYPASIVADVAPDRIRRYFVREVDGQYRINKRIREMAVFASQNVIKDPPFTKLHLLSCRNLLIYLGTESQRKLLPLFHYSLLPDGILLLGSSETVGLATDLFFTEDAKWKIFRSKPSASARHVVPAFPAVPACPEMREPEVQQTLRRAEELSVFQMVETILRQSDTPPCAIIDDACNVLYIHGRTGRYLEPAEGRVSVNILEMARPGLKAELAAAVRKVGIHKQEFTQRGIEVRHNGDHFFLDLTVRPILGQGALRGMMMVAFQETAPREKPGIPAPAPAAAKKKRRTAEELEQDLLHTRETLQMTIEELETSNEELKSTNEELQSTNEELQSTNEELQSTNEEMETSKEELQSLNEEASTVNAELQGRIQELTKTNDDIKNLLDSTDIATIFLDTDLCVRRFTPRISQMISLTGMDAGRPIKHFAVNLEDVDLHRSAEKVMGDLAVIEKEVKSAGGLYYLMRIRPYRTATNVIDGVVITFQDITTLKKAAHATRLAAVVRDSNDAITLQDLDGRITAWNLGAERMYGWTEAEALQMNIREVIPGDAVDDARRIIEEIRAGRPVERVATKRITKNNCVLDVWMTTTRLQDEAGNLVGIATTERNITDRIKAEEALHDRIRGLEETVEDLKKKRKENKS